MNVETLIRLSTFLGMLGVMAGWEVLRPRRRLTTSKRQRWAANLSVVVLNLVILRLLFAGGAMGLAMLAGERGWGLFKSLGWPAWREGGLAVMALDFVL